MYNLSFDRREGGRILSALRERQRKLDKGVAKFGDDFDPALGGHMLEGAQAYKVLIHKIQEAMDNE